MSTTDQILTAIVVGLALCIISLCWSLQQAHHRLDDLELEVYPDDDQEHEHTGPGPFHPECPVCNPSRHWSDGTPVDQAELDANSQA